MSEYIDYELERIDITSSVNRISYLDLDIKGKEISFVIISDIDGDVSVEVKDSDIEYLKTNLPSVEFYPIKTNDLFSVKTLSFINYVHDFVTEALDNEEIY